jgi:hypothetical protein
VLRPMRNDLFRGRDAAVGAESRRGEARRALLDEGGLPPSIDAKCRSKRYASVAALGRIRRLQSFRGDSSQVVADNPSELVGL